MTELTEEPSIVVLVDAVQLASQPRKLIDALVTIKHRFPGALVWTPGLGGPDNAAVLTWFGVDLFDLFTITAMLPLMSSLLVRALES